MDRTYVDFEQRLFIVCLLVFEMSGEFVSRRLMRGCLNGRKGVGLFVCVGF